MRIGTFSLYVLKTKKKKKKGLHFTSCLITIPSLIWEKNHLDPLYSVVFASYSRSTGSVKENIRVDSVATANILLLPVTKDVLAHSLSLKVISVD